MLATRTELVTIVSPGTSSNCWASAKVVVPADSAMAVPGATRAAAARAMASFCGCSSTDLASKPGSWLLGAPGSTAPPCTFSIRPARASASRSRRMVISDTPRRWVRSLTRALPARRMSSKISDCRCLASILDLPYPLGWLAVCAADL